MTMVVEEMLSATDVRVEIPSGDRIVEDVDLQLRAGEILGIVGESGSGKTTLARALLGYSSPGAAISHGRLKIGGAPMEMSDRMRSSRGSVIAYIPQNPGRALNPSLRIGAAIEDLLRAHRPDAVGRDGEIERLLEIVNLEATSEFARRFPHQISGGQQQRVRIAMALSCSPSVVVLDEPTTGLDVVTQARILAELLRLRDEQNVSMIYVTHDLAVVSRIADRIAVMYAGRIVEIGATEQIVRRPRHPYTRGLLSSAPDHLRPRALEPMPGIAAGVGDRPPGCAFAPRCPQRTPVCVEGMPGLSEAGPGLAVRCFHADETPPMKLETAQRTSRSEADEAPVLGVRHLRAEHGSGRHFVIAAEDISFDVARGMCVALVGESGSGKTTIARTVAGLHPIAAGEITLLGKPLASKARGRSVEDRRRIQIIFQNPADALNPRRTIGEAIERPARQLRGMDGRSARAEVRGLLEQVRLPARLAGRYPGELSGGECQRASIARALAAGPELLLCDEVTSALDVSVQAAVLALLDDLRRELGVSLLFITHDLGVVATIADEVIVLDQGQICERGATDSVLNDPQSEYTKRLLAAAPSVAGAIDDWDQVLE